MNKRILIFATSYYPLVGGAEVAMKELTDRLPDWEFDLVCAQIRPGLAKTETVGRVTVHRCGFGLPIDKYLLPILGVVRALRLTRGEKAPRIWSLMASYGGFAALVFTWFRPKTVMLLTLQEGDPLEHYASRAGAFEIFHRQIFCRANAVQSISHFLAYWATRMGFIGEPKVIPNGVDVDRFSVKLSDERRAAMREEFGFSEDDFVVVTVSRLSKKNAVDDNIRSLVSLPPNVKLLVVGEGEDREMLTSLVAQLELTSRVVFLGNRSQAELPAILQTADIFCRPSLSEGLGISFLEAMASGLPIVATPVGGIPDFLREGETGVFCQPRDPDSIALVIKRIMHDEALRERLKMNGRALVQKSYRWDTIAAAMNELMHTVWSIL